jgi:hypothetical protein
MLAKFPGDGVQFENTETHAPAVQVRLGPHDLTEFNNFAALLGGLIRLLSMNYRVFRFCIRVLAA